MTGQDALQLLVRRPSRQSPHPLCIPSPPLDVQIHASRCVLSSSKQVRPRGDGVTAQLPLWNRNRILPDPVLIGLPSPGENNVQFFLAPSAGSIIRSSSRNDPIPVAGRAFNDGPGPPADEIVSLPPNVRGDALALGVEENDTAETRLFENVGVDEVHFAENGEEFALDVEGRERAIWEGFEPTPDTFEEVIVDDGLGQRCSSRIIGTYETRRKGDRVLTFSGSRVLEEGVLA